MKLAFSGQVFEKKAQILRFVKIHPVGVELFHTDGQTDGQGEANNRFSQFCERA